MVLMLPTAGKGVASLDSGMILAYLRYFGTLPESAHSWNCVISLLVRTFYNSFVLSIVAVSPSIPVAFFLSAMSTTSISYFEM